MKQSMCLAACLAVASVCGNANADLISFDTGFTGDGLVVDAADNTQGTFTITGQTLTTGETFDVSFDVAADTLDGGSQLNGTNGFLGVGGSTVLNAGQSLTVSNIVLTGDVELVSIRAIGLDQAIGTPDDGTFTVGATAVAFDEVDDGDAFDLADGTVFDGTAPHGFDLFAALGDTPFSEFTLTNDGVATGAFALSAVQLEIVGTAEPTDPEIPEPASIALLGLGGLGMLVRRRK